ncbi:MAG: phosphatidate cytidylyltransferase, partial [Ignavibacteriae bacterium HGW-Ignavibacteriae-3]
MKKMNNLSTRVIVALIGVPVLIVFCLLGKIPFLALIVVIGLVSYFEFS